MRSLLISCIMAGLLLASTHAFADGATAKQEGPEKPMIKTAMGNKGTVFTGTVMKEVHGSGDGKGKETKVVIYSLATADDIIFLPIPKDIDLEAVVGKKVTIEGRSFKKKGDTHISKITKLTEVVE